MKPNIRKEIIEQDEKDVDKLLSGEEFFVNLKRQHIENINKRLMKRNEVNKIATDAYSKYIASKANKDNEKK